MPRKRAPLSELGTVAVHKVDHRAHINCRIAEGTQTYIYGPDRQDRHRAEVDLAQIRAAGAVGSTREQGLQIMAAEARRLQVSASFEAEVRAAVQRQLAEEA